MWTVLTWKSFTLGDDTAQQQIRQLHTLPIPLKVLYIVLFQGWMKLPLSLAQSLRSSLVVAIWHLGNAAFKPWRNCNGLHEEELSSWCQTPGKALQNELS